MDSIDKVNLIIRKIDNEIQNEIDFHKFLQFVDKQNIVIVKLLENIFGQSEICKLFVLKISNLLIAKYQFLRHHTTLIAKPFGLLVDPCNGCNLYCPGCVHSKNVANDFIWPKGNLTEEVFRRFLENYGPYATDIFFYNWGEPLLNKLTPVFIRLAKKNYLRTSISTNLSLRIDPEEIVTSGLDFMTIALDGATKESYSKYRKGGNFALVLENVKKLVEAKRKFKQRKPYLQYRFLLFEHNKHEKKLAKQLATELGVDELRFDLPFSVSWDDPSINVAKGQRSQQIFLGSYFSSNDDTGKSLEIENDSIKSAFSQNWSDLFKHDGNPENNSDLRSVDSTCHWLYKNVVMDARGKILACCMPPTPQRDLIFADFVGTKADLVSDVYNSEKFKLARQFFSDKQTFKKNIKSLRREDIPFCVKCKGINDSLTINNQILRYYLDEETLFSILSEDNKDILTAWNFQALKLKHLTEYMKKFSRKQIRKLIGKWT